MPFPFLEREVEEGGRAFKQMALSLTDFLSSIIQCPIANSQTLSTVQIAKADVRNNEILPTHDTQEVVWTDSRRTDLNY